MATKLIAHTIGFLLLALLRLQADADETVSWYDGASKRTLWIDPERVADITTQQTKGTPRFIKLDQVPKVTRRIFSPILFESASRTGAKWTLPGNIIVKLRPEWTEDQVTAWATRERITILRKLRIANTYVVKTQPGMPALELANRLFEKGEVLAAQPNWWKERALR